MEYFAFQWHITEACDQRCKHCYIYALGSHAKFKMMSVEEMRTVLDNIDTFSGRPNDCHTCTSQVATRCFTHSSGR